MHDVAGVQVVDCAENVVDYYYDVLFCELEGVRVLDERGQVQLIVVHDHDHKVLIVLYLFLI